MTKQEAYNYDRIIEFQNVLEKDRERQQLVKRMEGIQNGSEIRTYEIPEHLRKDTTVRKPLWQKFIREVKNLANI